MSVKTSQEQELERAAQKVERFVRRFQPSYRMLAYHAALPLVLTPELVNYLRVEFLRGEVPWVAEVDLLLSDLCRQVGYELYAMEADVRSYLLKEMKRELGEERMQEVAKRLIGYVKYLHQTNPYISSQELQAQQWAAMVYLEEPRQQAVKEIAEAFQQRLVNKAELARLARITQELAPQLKAYGNLVDYAALVSRVLTGSTEVKHEELRRTYKVLSGIELHLPNELLPDNENVQSLVELKVFEFEVVKVNEQGQIIQPEQRQARYFTEDLRNGVTLEMVAIPGGTFTMGAPENEEGSQDSERPQHPVAVKPFCMGKYPVTQTQWQAVLALPQVNRKLNPLPSSFKGSDQPIENVSWYDAVEFCARLSQHTGRLYRLPSEAEWEYACRAGTTTPFHFGETITTELANYYDKSSYGQSIKGEYREGTTVVGSFPANSFGLYDMHGNVREWCADSWHSNYEGAPTDGSVWEIENNNDARLLRGGSWVNVPDDCRCAYRHYVNPGLRQGNGIGFRVVCAAAWTDNANVQTPMSASPDVIHLTPELKLFEFEVVTVNNQGQIIQREQRQARYFTEDLGNGVTLEMVAIPGGTFTMGAPKIEKGSRDNERPQHQVSIKPFFMGKYPVTQAQWQAVAALPQVNRFLNPDPSKFKGADRPVEYVSWYDAVEFCARLSQHTGREYRLPSEAKWEYACRAGTTTPFHFGKTITTELASYMGSSTYGNAPEGEYRWQTTPVGSFPANAFGLYDMHGNVWEWCADSRHSNYEGAPTDGSVWEYQSKKDSRYRLLRGGSWYVRPVDCRSAVRYDFEPNVRDSDTFGFRVVCAAAWTL